jgi:hypothetical protein
MADAASDPPHSDAPLPVAFAAFAEPPVLPPRFCAPYDQEFASIEATVAATARGRWFLAEYARRVRARDSAPLIAALERIEKRLAEGVDLDALAQQQDGRGADGVSTLAGMQAALQAALRLPADFVARASAPANALPKSTPPRRRAHVGPPPSFLRREVAQVKAPPPAPASPAPLASFAPEAIAENPELEVALAQIAQAAADAAADAAAVARAALARDGDAPRKDAPRRDSPRRDAQLREDRDLTTPPAGERPAPSRKRPPAPLVSEPPSEPHEAA